MIAPLRLLAAALTLFPVGAAPPAYASTPPALFSVAPRIEPNPNPRAPLAAVLRFEAAVPVATRVTASDGDRQWRVDFPPGPAGKVALPIVGMKANRMHRFEVEVTDAAGQTARAPAPLEFRTTGLPSGAFDFPAIELTKRSAELEPGITLMTVRRRALGRPHMLTPAQQQFSTRWGMIVAIDSQGEVVWYYQSDRRIAGVAPLSNGNIFYHSHGSVPVEIDLLGNKVREWSAARGPVPPPPGAIPVEATTLHHQPEELPNGNFVSMMAEPRVVENYYTSEFDRDAPRKAQKVMGDDIIEFTPQGKVVWRWSAWDHLDPFRIGYETLTPYWWVRGFPDALDWTHGNGVHYDRRDDSLVISFRNQDAILKVDRGTREIKWILARDVGWKPELRRKLLRPAGANFLWPSHQHNPRVTAAGTIIVFNNNAFQAVPFTGEAVAPPDKSFSNAIEYEIDENAMTARVVFSTPDEAPEDSCNSFAMGDAHRLPKTDNILVAYSLCFPKLKLETFTTMDRSKVHPDDLPVTPKIVEYSRTSPARRLWEVRIKPPFDLMQWEVYGVYRLPSLYFRGS
jgi:arylsulfate sulfotransferase